MRGREWAGERQEGDGGKVRGDGVASCTKQFEEDEDDGLAGTEFLRIYSTRRRSAISIVSVKVSRDFVEGAFNVFISVK